MKMTQKMGQAARENKVALIGAALMVAEYANAAVITVPPELADAAGSVLVIGLAVFGIKVGIKLYQWIARALA